MDVLGYPKEPCFDLWVFLLLNLRSDHRADSVQVHAQVLEPECTCTGVPRSQDQPPPLQGYLAHKKQAPPPPGHHRALGIVLLYGPRGCSFL